MSKRARVIVLERNKKQPQGGVTRIFKTEAERGSHVWASVILPVQQCSDRVFKFVEV